MRLLFVSYSEIRHTRNRNSIQTFKEFEQQTERKEKGNRFPFHVSHISFNRKKRRRLVVFVFIIQYQQMKSIERERNGCQIVCYCNFHPRVII